MNDSVYAEKYAEGASKKDLPGKIKQALDARHTRFLEGWLISGGAQVRPRSGDAFGAVEIGGEWYQTSYFTSRLALSGLAGDDKSSLGVDVGARLQTPTRLAPFVGVGSTAGIVIQDLVPMLVESALSSDDDSFRVEIDDPQQTERWVAALYPEVGAHFWVDGRIRVTAFGRYLLTTEGREFDDWLVGGQLAIFRR